jgi:hypothetical protein
MVLVLVAYSMGQTNPTQTASAIQGEATSQATVAPAASGQETPEALKRMSAMGCEETQPVPAGIYEPSEDVIVVVREVDFNRVPPQAWYRIQRLGPNQGDKNKSLKVGPGAKGAGKNVDAWQCMDDIGAANIEAFKVLMADIDGNIENMTFGWLQMECVKEQLEQAQKAGIAENFKTEEGQDNWFLKVEKDMKFNIGYLKVCEVEAGGGEEPTPQPSEPTKEPTAQPEPTVKPRPTVVVNCGNVSAATPGSIVPAGTIVVYEVVDYDAGTVEVTAMVLDKDTKAGAQPGKPMTHINMWHGFCNLATAKRDAAGQADEREMEAATPGNWAEGYTVTLK